MRRSSRECQKIEISFHLNNKIRRIPPPNENEETLWESFKDHKELQQEIKCEIQRPKENWWETPYAEIEELVKKDDIITIQLKEAGNMEGMENSNIQENSNWSSQIESDVVIRTNWLAIQFYYNSKNAASKLKC